jgi:hypothetical protein
MNSRKLLLYIIVIALNIAVMYDFFVFIGHLGVRICVVHVEWDLLNKSTTSEKRMLIVMNLQINQVETDN